MDETTRGHTTTFTRAARTRRMLDCLREGWGYRDVASVEGLSERRVRQIVAGHVKRRAPVDADAHAALQIERLGFAVKVAGEALAKGDIRAIAPYIKAIDQLDAYQTRAHKAAPQPFRTRPTRWRSRCSSTGFGAASRPRWRRRPDRPFNPAAARGALCLLSRLLSLSLRPPLLSRISPLRRPKFARHAPPSPRPSRRLPGRRARSPWRRRPPSRRSSPRRPRRRSPRGSHSRTCRTSQCRIIARSSDGKSLRSPDPRKFFATFGSEWKLLE